MGCLPRGVSAWGCLPKGCLPRRWQPRGTGYLPREGDVCPEYTEFLTYACENITFPQLLLQKVTMHICYKNCVCKSNETNYDILNSNLNPEIGGGTSQ